MDLEHSFPIRFVFLYIYMVALYVQNSDQVRITAIFRNYYNE